MMTLMYVIPLVAWITFIHIQYKSGDRPTTHIWYAIMAGLGTFECAEGFFRLGSLPAVELALGAGLLAAASVLVARTRSADKAISAGAAV